MKKIILSLFIIQLAQAYSTGNEVGNGGDVVLCKKPFTIEMLDLYEARKRFKISKDNRPYREIINSIIHKLSTIDEDRSNYIKSEFASFIKKSSFEKNAKLINIEDSKHFSLPKDKSCSLEQIAIKRKEVLPNDSKFIINNDLWEKLDQQNKAALILHEIIYDYFTHLGENNSIKARYYVGYLFNSDLKLVEKSSYRKMIKELKIPIYLN